MAPSEESAANSSPEQHHPPKAETANKAVKPEVRGGANGTGSIEAEMDKPEEAAEPHRVSIDLEELPIELVSLTDSFIDSLSAKVHPAPPNVDNLSHMFQDFYIQAAAHINTHIAALATRQSREQSPMPANSRRTSAASLLRGKSGPANHAPPEQQMLTAEELAERKRAKKLLEQKRGLLEEAVERRLCEGIYDRIYRHHSTQDEASDDKLRSKTAALALVGIGPSDLGVDLGELSNQTPQAFAERKEEVRRWLDRARKELTLMSDSRYPLGKLNHLKTAHKAIVETLAHFHPSSSADEIMPMLIYTLITLPPEKLTVVSDLNFIQRFRTEHKIEGEAAYCLTNLEAAIVFLDTVDLSTLRADEAPSGPPKAHGSKPGSPRSETFPPAYTASSSTTAAMSFDAAQGTTAGAKSPAPNPAGLRAATHKLHNRRLSDLVNTPAQALSSASDAVMNTFNAADQSFKTIGNSLEGSYKVFFGKFAKQAGQPAHGGEIVVPKTLDDARKLIGTPPPAADDDSAIASGASSLQEPEEADGRPRRLTPEDRIISLLAGKSAAAREHSADSAKSGNSARKVGFPEETATPRGGGGGSTSSRDPSATPASGTATPLGAAADSIRNLGNSLNPMARFGGFRGFGRTPSTSSTPVSIKEEAVVAKPVEGGDLATAFPELAGALPPKPQIDPPKRRFMELQNPADLKIGEVLELLRDYRRLATALRDLKAFKEA